MYQPPDCSLLVIYINQQRQDVQPGQRFHRLSGDTPGHGLGLASVQAIVQLHGAQLTFEDAAPGLRVRLTLPLLPT